MRPMRRCKPSCAARSRRSTDQQPTTTFSRTVSLAPRERKIVRFSPADTPQLNLQHPRIWWPYRMGEPHQYQLSMTMEANGAESDRQDVRFGVNELTSELTDKGHR